MNFHRKNINANGLPVFFREFDGKYRKTFNVGIGKNPLINGITSTEIHCVIEFGENVMTSR